MYINFPPPVLQPSMSNVPSQSQLHEVGCSSATSPLIASSGTKRKRPSGKSTEALGNQAVQASNGKEAELSCGDEVPNDETTSVSIGCAAKVTVTWPAEVTVTQPAEVTGTQPAEWSCSFRLS